jgi:hypothetical protein
MGNSPDNSRIQDTIMSLTDNDLLSQAHKSIAERPMGFSIVSMLNAMFGEAAPNDTRRFTGMAMPSVESDNLGKNRWVNTRINEWREGDQFVGIAENAHRMEIIVTYWNDRLARCSSESVHYGFMDFKQVVDDVSHFLLHGTRRRETSNTNNVVCLIRRG